MSLNLKSINVSANLLKFPMEGDILTWNFNPWPLGDIVHEVQK